MISNPYTLFGNIYVTEGLFTPKHPSTRAQKSEKIQKIQGFFFEDFKSVQLIWE